jgi:diguanylate cyclase (GGDEF)-like protein/PAS domain S-box-containing protein
MTLRKATILFVCLGTLVLLGVISLATHLVINASFRDLERDHALRNLERARNAVSQELSSLDEILVDWAVWDDSKDFLLGRAPDFVESNLNDRTLASLRLTAIIFLDKAGQVAWAKGFDPVQGIKAPLPEGLDSQLTFGSPLLHAKSIEDRVKGLLLLPQGLMLTASCPITGSDGLGPPVGTLVMLRAINAQEGAAIAERVRLPLAMERADTPPDKDIAPLASELTGGMKVGPVSSDLYGAVLFLPDIWGEPALRLVLRDTRQIMNRGDYAMNMALVLMILGTLMCFAVLLVYLERRVLRRLARLKFQVEAIGADAADPVDACAVGLAGDDDRKRLTLGRVNMPGNDELSSLALRINGALAELERSRQNLANQCAMTREQENYLQQLLNSIQAGGILVDPRTHIIREVNAFAAAAIGRPRPEIIGKLCHGFLCPTEQGKCPLTDLHQSGDQTVRSLLRADGSLLPVLKSVSTIERDGKPLLLETFIEVENLHKAQEALKRSEETYRTVFMNTGTATILIEADTTIRLVNQEFEKLSGFSREEIEGRLRWTEFFNPEDVEWMVQHHVRRRQSPELAPRNYEARFINRSGETRLTLLTRGMIPDTDVSEASLEDITERKQAEEQLRHQAFHDSLTGLPNRQLLLDRLERAVESARREGHQIAVLLLDLDRFKDVNDALGHSAGDRLLKLVAARLLQAVRRSDTVARLGGDEFVLVVDGAIGRDTGDQVARHVLKTFAQPFDLDGRSLHVLFSVGIALFPEHGESPEVLLKNADLAMYRAKEAGRNTFEFFSKDLNDQVLRRLAVEAGLRRAMSSGGVEVFYQPKMTQPGNVISGVEALVRLRREDGSLISPAEVIPVAENTGLILPLSDLVLRAACRQIVEWRKGRHNALSVAVNLSPRQFFQPGLTERIIGILKETGAPPEALEFEITENLLMDHRPETLDSLAALRGLGATVVLDDFGKEYSSLSYIKKLPIQAIKIDRSFIDGLPEDEDDASIIKSVLSLAQDLELRVVAEGVETKAQLDFLVARGCVEFQGYLFSRPLPALDMTALLEQPNPFDAL